jgi:hypothetical protein
MEKEREQRVGGEGRKIKTFPIYKLLCKFTEGV